MKFLNGLSFSWFDIFLLLWLTLGLFRGRKRGMSAELLTFLQWATIVLVCAFTYQPISEFLSKSPTKFTPLFANITGYLLAAGVVSLAFMLLKRLLGGKLIGSDTFGRWEYYLGMPAGVLRYLCMVLTGLALLNARLYTAAEIKAYKDFQMKNFDSEFFPGLQKIQADVFGVSFSGGFIKKQLSILLIQPKGQGGRDPFKQKPWEGP